MKKDLAQFPSITELSIYVNELRFLPGDLFEGNPKLSTVDFSNNKITRVGSNLLASLTELKHLKMYENLCIDKAAHSQLEIAETIKDFEEKCSEKGFEDDMKQLIIDKLLRKLKTTERIEKNLKTELKSVKHHRKICVTKLKAFNGNLNAATNLLSAVLSNQEDPLKSSVEASKIRCKLNEKTCEVFGFTSTVPLTTITRVVGSKGFDIDFSSTKIENLHMHHQQTFFLPSNLGLKFLNLKTLLVFESGLFSIDRKVFENMKSLTAIKINKNKIREIRASSFKANNNLESLDLAMNKIESIDDAAFAGLANLCHLNVSMNVLSSLKAAVFQDLVSLESLDFHKNQLKSLESKTFSGLRQLRKIDISRE
jgi:Leucine-rich repeat (LRR) protein